MAFGYLGRQQQHDKIVSGISSLNQKCHVSLQLPLPTLTAHKSIVYTKLEYRDELLLNLGLRAVCVIVNLVEICNLLTLVPFRLARITYHHNPKFQISRDRREPSSAPPRCDNL